MTKLQNYARHDKEQTIGRDKFNPYAILILSTQ
jgi:hypothetical protein